MSAFPQHNSIWNRADGGTGRVVPFSSWSHISRILFDKGTIQSIGEGQSIGPRSRKSTA